MGRVHALALRVGTLINWSADVHHKVLEDYVSHVFQHNIHSTPFIRASTTGIEVQVTVLRNVPSTDTAPASADVHPLLTDPKIHLAKAQLDRCPGRFNRRMYNVRKQEKYFQDIFHNGLPETLIKQAKLTTPESDPQHILGVYSKYPVNVRVNVIQNPLLNAQCFSRYLAKSFEDIANKPERFIAKLLPARK